MSNSKKIDQVIIDGKKITVGDFVSFKSDVEQSGQVTQIWNNGNIGLYREYGFSGDYIGGQQHAVVHKSDCWVE